MTPPLSRGLRSPCGLPAARLSGKPKQKDSENGKALKIRGLRGSKRIYRNFVAVLERHGTPAPRLTFCPSTFSAACPGRVRTLRGLLAALSASLPAVFAAVTVVVLVSLFSAMVEGSWCRDRRGWYRRVPSAGCSALSNPPLSDALFPVRRQEGGITTGVALHNLESSPGLLRCDLMREGVLLDSASIPLEANGQTSWLIDQAFPAADTSAFAGSVRCDAVGEGLFSAVALEMDPGNRIFTTLPVVPVPEMQDRE